MAVGAQLATSTIVQERKDQTFLFVMSLPISHREYRASKILGNLLIFLVPWLTLVLGSFALILATPRNTARAGAFCRHHVHGNSGEHLPGGGRRANHRIPRGDDRGTVTTGNLALNGFGYHVAHVHSIAKGMWSAPIGWTPAASGLLAAEIAAVALLLGVTFFY
jgi:ABC-type Na+ efflux pump permease subunit